MKEFEAQRLTPEEVVMWKRSASYCGYHYLACAKTFALIGKALAEATIQLQAARLPEKNIVYAKLCQIILAEPRAGTGHSLRVKPVEKCPPCPEC